MREAALKVWVLFQHFSGSFVRELLFYERDAKTQKAEKISLDIFNIQEPISYLLLGS